MRKAAFTNQVKRETITGLLVVGFLFMCLTIVQQYFLLLEDHTVQKKELVEELESVVSRALTLQSNLNEGLLVKASEQANRVYRWYRNNSDASSNFERSGIDYRLIDGELQVFRSSYESGLPRPFVPNPFLNNDPTESTTDFYNRHIEQIRLALLSGTIRYNAVRILVPSNQAAYVLYKPYTHDLLLEISIDVQREKEAIRQFMVDQMTFIMADYKVNALTFFNQEGIYFTKGSMGGFSENAQQSQVLNTQKHDMSISGNQYHFIYRFEDSIILEALIPYALKWLMYFAMISVALILFNHHESNRFLNPLLLLINTSKDARHGRFEKRIELTSYREWMDLAQAYNQRMDSLCQLLEDKKEQEYKLREIIRRESEQQQLKNREWVKASAQEKHLRLALAEANRFYMQMLHVLSNSIESKDHYTSGHCQRVLSLSVQIAEWLGMDEETTQDIGIAALLHDVGKLGIDEALLNQREPLTDYQWQVLKRHPQIGEEILTDFNVSSAVKQMVGMHHERYDGKGYPYQVSGEDIPIGARIICLADAYDAMISIRPYRLIPLKPEAIIDELTGQSGAQFDPFLVDYLVNKIQSEGRQMDAT